MRRDLWVKIVAVNKAKVKTKAPHGSKCKQRCSLLPIKPDDVLWLPGSKALIHVATAPEDKHHKEMSPTSFFPLALISELKSYCMVHPCGQFESDGLIVPPPRILPTHQPAAGRVWKGVECWKSTVLMQCKHCSTVVKTLVCYQCHYGYKTQHYEKCCGEN